MIVNQTAPYPISFLDQKGQALICRYQEEGRQYIFAPDIDITGLTASVQFVKPDNTFVIESAEVVEPEEGPAYIVVTIPVQATVVKGVGRYSVFITDPEDEDFVLYSAEGTIWADDHLITEEMIESVAEVYGLRFPQDFLTVENLVDIVNYVRAVLINDDVTGEDTTWSSEKIEQEIQGFTPEPITDMATGNPVTLTDAAATPLVSCSAAILASQDLHGYDKPWVGGAGVNRWDEEWEVGGLSSTGGNMNAPNRMRSKNYIPILENTNYYFCIGSSMFNAIKCFYDENKTFISTMYGNDAFTSPEGAFYMRFSSTNDNYGNVYHNDLAVNYPSTVTTYSPYSNICPITGISDLEINIAATDQDTPETSTIDLGGTCYGGTAHPVDGKLFSTWDYIASYNGELLPGLWLSDRDAYAPGTTPTTGAEVAYETGGIVESDISPTQIYTLLGDNYITTNAESLSLEYIRSPYDALCHELPHVTQNQDGNLLGVVNGNWQTVEKEAALEPYTSAETVVGKWTDDRPVYQKVISGTIHGSNALAPIAHSISNLDRIISVTGSGKTSGINYLFTSTKDAGYQYLGIVYADDTNLYFQNGTFFNVYNIDYLIVVRYIKTA